MSWVVFVPRLLVVLKESMELMEALHGAGGGESKKQAVLDVVKALCDGLGFNTEAIVKWAGAVIDITVFVWNLTGKWKRSTI